MTTNERLLVLNLLRDGKITTEEAESLLRALGDTAETPPRSEKKRGLDDWLWQIGKGLKEFDTSQLAKDVQSAVDRLRRTFEGMARDVQRTVHPTSSDTGPWELAERATVRITQKGGNIRLAPSHDNRLRVGAPTFHVELMEEKQRAEVAIVGGTGDVFLPSQARRAFVEVVGGGLTIHDLALDALTVRVVGGRATLERLNADIEAHLIGGSLHLADVETRRVEADTNGGAILARFGDVREGTIRLAASAGGVTAELGANSDFEVGYAVSGGVFDCQWETVPIGENRARVGEGMAKLELVANGGSISLLRRT